MTRLHALLGSILLVAPMFAQRADLELHRGWDDTTAHLFWHQDQGSELMPKAWFDNLKYKDGQKQRPFSEGLERFGFIPDPDNPQLPYIGLAIHTDEKNNKWIGLTCAACHTGQWKYNGKRVVVDGAPAMLDFDAFFEALVAAIDASPDAGSPATDYKELRDKLHRRIYINHSSLRGGFGRVDAFGQIFNQVSVIFNGNGDDARGEPDAPASYPCLWDIAQHKFVQWNGSAPNLGVEGNGAKLRNIGEIIGVFGDLIPISDSRPQVPPKLLATLPSKYRSKPLPKFRSSVNYQGITTIEHWIGNLRSPQWPQNIFGNLGDLALGDQMYSRYCERCHTIVRGAPQYPLPITMVLADDVGTDPALVDNFGRVAKTNGLQGNLVLADPRSPLEVFGRTAPIRQMTGYYAVGVLRSLESANPTFPIRSLLDGLQAFAAGPPEITSYKARPLDGVWATAPYLHNGSVPNLWELLQDPGKRDPSFCVGDEQFDAKDVGYTSVKDGVTECPPGSFRFDTSLPGNRNSGHAYGVNRMSDTQKRALIEFLKSL